jgi:predicted secreted Zn-dependent protease
MGRRVVLAALLFALLAACRAEEGPRPPASSLPARNETVLVAEMSRLERVRLSETVTRRTYEVEGVSDAAIRASLDSRGPALVAGASGGSGRYDAVAEWSLHWSFRYERGAGFCALGGADLTLEVVVTLPEHSDAAALPPDLAARWQAFVAALEAHEMGHVGRQRAVAAGLVSAFEGAPPAADCGAFGRQLNALGQEHLDRMRFEDASYDEATSHGMTEGAIFP